MVTDGATKPDQIVRIRYKNWRGETSLRSILPEKIWYGSTKWHPEEQWFLDALDMEKQEHRSFALLDIQEWFRPARAE